jgi:hypothetical protein
MWIISAHGALGYWDEVIFVGVAVVFLLMMGISWLKSRDSASEYDPKQPIDQTTSTDGTDHFRLQ